jgi:hypothetical protein
MLTPSVKSNLRRPSGDGGVEKTQFAAKYYSASRLGVSLLRSAGWWHGQDLISRPRAAATRREKSLVRSELPCLRALNTLLCAHSFTLSCEMIHYMSHREWGQTSKLRIFEVGGRGTDQYKLVYTDIKMVYFDYRRQSRA